MSSNLPYTVISKSVKRRFKQHSPKYWRHYIRSTYRIPKTRGRLGPRAKAIGLTPSSRRELKVKFPLGHYEDYLRRPIYSRGLTPRGRGRPRGAGRVPMGELGPELIFDIRMVPIVRRALLDESKGVYRDIISELKRLVKNVVTHVQTDLVGDPRTFGGGRKGLVPRGGTGYMRLITRSYMESQIRKNRDFPFTLYFKIPVMYAKPLNAMVTYQLAHSGKYGWRIVDYTPSGRGLKARYQKIRLNDPSAVGGFFEKSIEIAKIYTATKFITMLRRIMKYNSSALVGVTDMLGNDVKIRRDSFILSPSEFSELI